MSRLRPHLSYANVTATLALFVAVSGAGAYAANQIGRKSVGAPELRPGAVTAVKLRKNAVITPKVNAKAITAPKLAAAAVTARILASGSVSAEKIAYQAITHDKVGLDALTGEQIVESSLSPVPRATFAATAATADSAQPTAFAAVDETGAIDASLSKGLSPGNVIRTGTGAYCVTVPAFDPRGAQATARNDDTDGRITAYVTIGGASGCAAPRVEVQTYSNGVNADAPFYVVLYR